MTHRCQHPRKLQAGLRWSQAAAAPAWVPPAAAGATTPDRIGPSAPPAGTVQVRPGWAYPMQMAAQVAPMAAASQINQIGLSIPPAEMAHVWTGATDPTQVTAPSAAPADPSQISLQALRPVCMQIQDQRRLYPSGAASAADSLQAATGRCRPD